MSCVVLAACTVSRAHARAAAALLALALLLGAGVASTTAAVAQENVTNCALLEAKNAKRRDEGGWRDVSDGGRTMNVKLVWGSEPARAAAALLGVLLRHVRLFRGVRLAPACSPLDTAALAATVPFDVTRHYTELIIGLSTAWEPKAASGWIPRAGRFPGLAGPRLEEFGTSPVPARRRLFAWLAPRVRSACRGHERWAFYSNPTALVNCEFVDSGSAQDSAVDVLVVRDYSDCNATATLQRLVERANATHTRLNLTTVDRAQFLHALDSTNHSFLFLDWDMWQGAANVSVVESPPCVSVDFDCKQEIDSTVAMRVADVDMLKAHASLLFYFVYDFSPSPKSLRQILERQASGVDIEEAACEWALKNKSYAMIPYYDIDCYNVITYVCIGDPDRSLFQEILKIVQKEVNNQTALAARWDVLITQYNISCSEKNMLSNKIHNWKSSAAYLRILGIVSLSVEGVAAASHAAIASHMPLMLADVAPEQGSAAEATWHVAGRPRHIARALLHFVREARWTRLAVLSQNTSELAADYYATLKDQKEIRLREFLIPLSLGEQETQAVLQDLRDVNARIVFINADSQAAVTIVNAAAAAGMGYSDGYVWIVREWRQSNIVCETKHFMVSFWSRSEKDLTTAEEWASLRGQLVKLLGAAQPDQPWPPRAVSLVDALLSLTMGLKEVFRQHPDSRLDLRKPEVLQSLKESLIKKPVASISQRLHYAERSIEETRVFLEQWCGGVFEKRLATWRVNATSGEVLGNFSRPSYLPLADGASGCIVWTGDPFDPSCHDIACACALVLLVLSPGAVLLAYRALRRRLARLLHEQQIEVIARRRHVATVLAAYLVERAALELREELGAGRFGSVCLARLRVPGRAPRYIAAKALRDNAAPAEESEFLREACTIASLSHAHIVRLVGVCIADGPPLVLMELAFFGDLLGYLRERRHLVEGTGSEEPAESGEAEHVSAEALTRLAREAAEALQYLSTRGVVHRDVRAANCLVDVRRSLKLADFGMARDTVAGADGAPEYACRRRGLFPVLWMAPESLAHGVFSAASDVWALGVLMLELVTLGVRPYGSMSPLRVLEYVAAGGSPPLPLDATPQTRGLARLCWARAAERRPSAAEVAAYLAAWPRALCPALLSQHDEPADADSGFGESPSTELLPPDSPLHSLYQFDDLAATH